MNRASTSKIIIFSLLSPNTLLGYLLAYHLESQTLDMLVLDHD